MEDCETNWRMLTGSQLENVDRLPVGEILQFLQVSLILHNAYQSNLHAVAVRKNYLFLLPSMVFYKTELFTFKKRLTNNKTCFTFYQNLLFDSSAREKIQFVLYTL